MSASGIFDGIREILRILAQGFWALVALVFDTLSDLGAFWAGIVILGLAVLAVVLAKLMQRRLVRELKADPEAELSYWRQEIPFFLPAWPVMPLYLLGRALVALGRWLARLIRRGDRNSESTPSPAEAPFLAASLGPSFLMAALLAGLVYWLCRWIEPLLRVRLNVTPGSSVWQYLFLGHRPELAPYLPLDRSPYLAGVLVFLLWLTVWWWLARGIRLVYWGALRRSLHRERNERSVLRPWREWFAVEDLIRPASPYRRWAGTLLGVSAPLAGWAWLSLASVPYRLGPSELAVAWVLGLGWGIHLLLRGEERLEPETIGVSPSPLAPESPAGWPAVLEDLSSRHRASEPKSLLPARPFGERRWVALDVRDPLLSSLLVELLPEHPEGKARLTEMQLEELRRLSRLGHVHTRPAPPAGELALGDPLPSEKTESVRERNRIVLAPEGAGKTTLALLAAANQALVHTRSTLLVTRDEKRASAVTRRLRDRLNRSTLRWNLRLRQAGGDLASDLSKGILPDVVVTSLHHLVVNLLDQVGSYEPFLRNLGLIVVDDVESFAGPVETHAQLAFRRLTLMAGKILGVDQLGEDSAPLILVLGSESVHRMPTWAEALCGIEAETRRYPHHSHGASPSERSEGGESKDDGIEEGEPQGAAAEDRGSSRTEGSGEDTGQKIYRLRDFRAASGEHLDLGGILAACERQGVPWHYRRCRDGQRHLGRRSLPLTEEPEHHVENPLEAVVVFLDGSWAEARREVDRLVLAGSESGRDLCALLILSDPDEDMALTQWDRSLDLARELTLLPRPVLRPPTGGTIHAHMAADLVQSWTEVEGVLNAFGNASAHKLRQLAREGLLLSEERVDIRKDVQEYEPKLWVRALATAVAENEEGDGSGEEPARRAPLPTKVAQVELPAGRILPVLDRTDLSLLDRVESASVDFRYYPGRIFANAGGRYLIVHRAGQEGKQKRDPGGRDPGEDGPEPSGALLAEPLVTDDVSSPRCAMNVEVVDTGDGPTEDRDRLTEPTTTGHAFTGPDPVLIGEHPFHALLARVRVTRQHFATLRLGPVFAEVRQRRIFDRESRDRFGSATLDTVALGILPNPPGLSKSSSGPVPSSADPVSEPSSEGQPKSQDEDCPQLRLEPARLIAAAMRLVLPSLYRGAKESLDVALHVQSAQPLPETLEASESGEPLGLVLGETDGFFLFDLSQWGNGTARSIHREGIELLLRLTRLVIERVLYHDRLRALYDHWATEDSPAGGWAPPAATAEGDRGSGGSPAERLEAQKRHDEAVRHAALEWLDSRLRPEGTPAASADVQGRYGSACERGEGDVFDIGRCWYSRTGTVTDLLWAKHRWRIGPGTEAMIDVAFDRGTAEEARDLRERAWQLEAGRRAYREYLEHPKAQLPDGTAHGGPRGVWGPLGEDEKLQRSQVGSKEATARAYHEKASALAVYAWHPLRPLTFKLLGHARESPVFESLEPRLRITSYLARFVQGIPAADRKGDAVVWTPIETLLYRQGDTHAKSLLLALLLERCDIRAGLFVSAGRSPQHVLVGAAVPEPVQESLSTRTVHRDPKGQFASQEDAVGDPEHYQAGTRAAEALFEHLESWRKNQAHLDEPLPLWAELPRLRRGKVDGVDVYVPIETQAALPVGAVWIDKVDDWVFLPMSAVRKKLVPEEEDEPGNDTQKETEDETGANGEARVDDHEPTDEPEADDRPDALDETIDSEDLG